MVLKACPNESGECAMDGCDHKESHCWYLLYGKRGDPKMCKPCYEKGQSHLRKESGKRAREEDEEGAGISLVGDTLVEIVKIYGTQCVSARSNPCPCTAPPAVIFCVAMPVPSRSHSTRVPSVACS